MESKLQTHIIKFLKENGAYVIKTKPAPGTPVGCPDIIALYGDKHCEIEVKASATAPFRPGQQATLDYLRRNNKFVYVAYPENWPLIAEELTATFFQDAYAR